MGNMKIRKKHNFSQIKKIIKEAKKYQKNTIYKIKKNINNKISKIFKIK